MFSALTLEQTLSTEVISNVLVQHIRHPERGAGETSLIRGHGIVVGSDTRQTDRYCMSVSVWLLLFKLSVLGL
jgi:hypothetical protein